MNIKFDSSEKIIQHRRLFVGFIVGLTVLLLLLLNWGSWNLLNRMEDNLENELGLRLLAIADILANSISSEYEMYPKDQLFSAILIEQTLPLTLKRVKEKNQLQAAFLIDEDYLVLAGDDWKFELSERTYVKQDSLDLQKAWQGLTSVSRLHIFEGNRFKSAYAPIVNDEGEIIAVLVIEASARFFDMLQFFQKGLILTIAISLVILVIFSFFLYRAISFLLRNYESTRRSERLAMMGQMSASVAHEIRNPLSIIKSTGDVLKEAYDNPEQPNELFDFIPSEVKRLNRIVTDLLTFAREPKLELRHADIKATILQVKLEIEQECNQNNIDVRIDFADDLPSINYDPDAIHQVLFNMLLNAVQAIEKDGTITLSVDKFSAKGKKYIRIEIADTGSGITGDINKIFDPFFTTKTRGTGLGLAICRQIVEKHGGRVEAESRKNEGTKMRIYLPF